MNTLRQFSEKERHFFAYQARQDFLRQQGTILFEKDEAVAERDAALAREQTALEEKAAAIAEVERLKALLAQK